ncbi:hypothetical protein FQV27_13080 [Paracoccus aurantiacus]|uniref:Uncharacterized protein n=1 Tax=Paracoccus aurantiacus TaxID=2599412 RepID=A0A5C6S3H7_9RHOB|nr:hypothetical protein [Paracoccus aurantiacus]TXB68112.1 hypothetical protein FQV27_13080 [Paracoccus aurantiacus]
MAATAMQMSGGEGYEQFLDVVLAQLSDFRLSSEAADILHTRVADGFRQALTAEESRLAEFRENSRRLGQEIARLQKASGDEKVIGKSIIAKAFSLLCPGFFPFC